MKPTLIRLVLCAAVCASPLAYAAPTLVQDVRLFDGKAIHEHRSVLFERGVIVDADFKGSAPAGSRVVNGAGRTLLPGLIDAHTHAFRAQELPVLFGVTTQIDMFTDIAQMQKAKQEMAQGGNHARADLFSAGTLVTAPHGHGTQFGLPIPTITGPEQAQAFVDARIAEGSDFIKIVMESGYGFQSLDLATAKAVIEAAHRRGKLAVVHIGNEKDARAVLEAGADGLVHLFPGTSADARGLAALARDKGAFVIPTFTVLESMAGWRGDDLLADPAFAGLLDKEGQAPLKARYGNKAQPERLLAPKAVTKALVDAGVPLLAGTDAGNPGTQYGASMHRELAALVDAGLTPTQALAAATSVPARVFKLGRRGSIEKGYKADLLLVEGNPSADILATRRIVEVWKDGESANGLRDAQRRQVAKEQQQGGKALVLPADGRISQFSQQQLASPFGMGWGPSTQQLAPDIVLTDIEMPQMTGLELTVCLAERGAPCRVVIVTTFGRSGYLRRALAAGVRGYLLKDAPADTLASAIRSVHGGGRAIAPELALELWGGGQDPLSERERQVLRLAGEGRSSADIARQVHLSEGTVRNYLSEAISKLGAGNRVEAYRMARDAGWL